MTFILEFKDFINIMQMIVLLKIFVIHEGFLKNCQNKLS
jgi:hypothetical protein